MAEQKINDLFKIVDANRNGSVELDELTSYLKNFGPAMNKAELEILLGMLGLEGKTSLTRGDFDVFLKKDVAITFSIEDVTTLFKVFDPLNTGEVKKIC